MYNKGCIVEKYLVVVGIAKGVDQYISEKHSEYGKGVGQERVAIETSQEKRKKALADFA